MADTICAIATATGGGIGIIRVSGPRAEAIGRGMVASLPEGAQSHRLYHGEARDPASGEVLDEVLACLMRAPHSYTGETVLELHGHGGAANLGRMLRAVVRAGARVAEPGEFTKRAFLAGRIDLARAEAVALVIAARSERAVRQAQAQLRGALSEQVAALRERLVAQLAEVEARVDFPDEHLDFVPSEQIAAELLVLAEKTEALAASYGRGRLLVEGVDVVLVGRANAGKSSLLNELVGEERALVDAAPGTTRDFVEAEVDLAGVRVVLVDTAGERGEGDAVERRGLELGRARWKRADLVVLVVDATAGFGEVEARIVSERAGAAMLVAWNKSDLAGQVARVSGDVPEGMQVVVTSAVQRGGADGLRKALVGLVADVPEEGAVVTSERQREALAEAGAMLRSGASVLGVAGPPELAAVDLRAALVRLGWITGESVDAEVLDRIFASFCIGK